MPTFVSLLTNHRPKSLRGKSLGEVFTSAERQPSRLRAQLDAWGGSRLRMQLAPPCLVFAAIGQARADGRLSPEQESWMLADLLTDWAMRNTLDVAAICSTGLPTGVALKT